MNLSIDQLHFLTLNVGFAHQNGDWNWKNVRSPFARLYYVTEGEAQVAIGSDLYTCHASFSHYYIHIYEDQQDGVGILDEYTFPVEVEATDTDLELIKRLSDMNPFLKLPESNPQAYDNHPTLINNIRLNKQRPFHDKLESRGILFILMSHFFKQAVPKVEVKDDRIHQTIAFIRKHLDSHLDIESLADKACMSKDHFIRVFKKETGETPNVYITKLKLEKAELVLATSALSIKGVAQMLGYNDYSYFNRVFKQNIGVTPQQYRENL